MGPSGPGSAGRATGEGSRAPGGGSVSVWRAATAVGLGVGSLVLVGWAPAAASSGSRVGVSVGLANASTPLSAGVDVARDVVSATMLTFDMLEVCGADVTRLPAVASTPGLPPPWPSTLVATTAAAANITITNGSQGGSQRGRDERVERMACCAAAIVERRPQRGVPAACEASARSAASNGAPSGASAGATEGLVVLEVAA